jgi:3-oxoacyl-[acyl-carrier-protein] synthase-3
MTRKVVVRATGRYVPPKVLNNKDFEKIVDTTDEWITTRTGIKERHVCLPPESNSTMAEAACRLALNRAGVKPEDIDLIILASVTPEMIFPSTACILQGRLGATRAVAWDMNGACSGFIYALSTAHAFLLQRKYRYALVVGSEVMSAIMDFTDRNTCVLFGDAASVFLLEGVETDKKVGITSFAMGCDGTQTEILYQPAGGSKKPPTIDTVLAQEHFIKMSGQDVFKRAVRVMADVVRELVDKNGVRLEEVRWFVPHQANVRIIQSAASRLNVPKEKVYLNIHRYGNTTAASIPMCVDELWEQGNIVDGDQIILFTFGAGFTWASCHLIWGGP